MSLREWLMLLGAVIVIGIVLDGIRRMHRARKDSMEISRGMGADDLEDSPLDSFNPELPSGGARIIDRLGVSARQRAEADSRPLQSSPDRGYVSDEPTEEGLSAGDRDDHLSEDFGLHGDARADADRAWSARPAEPREPERDETHTERNAQPSDAEIPTLKAASSYRRGSEQVRGKSPLQETRRSPATAKPVIKPTRPASQPARPTAQSAPAPQAKAPGRPLAGANRPPAKEVFVVNVDSRSPEGFRGGDLKRLFEACGLEHGDMGIYHRHENDDTETPVQFSVANAVEPGTFSPREMEHLSTPAISFFMSLPGPTDSLQAYEFMIETAQCVVRNLGGDLKDERRSVVTAQTIEHGRQRVREFERKRRSVKA